MVKEAAAHEPAWQGAGTKKGLQIWRINKFKVEKWPEKDYGKFYSGDSYIVLNTKSPKTDKNGGAYDLHFWIGKDSTQDEYVTVALKATELDTYLDDKPIQHREEQNKESPAFKKLFPHLTYMDGGVESGFRHVKPPPP